MSVQQEPTPCLRWLSLSQNDQPVPDSMLEPWQQSMVESFRQDTMVHRRVLSIARTQHPKYVRVRCTLKLTPLHTRPAMVFHSQAVSYMLQTRPAIHALVSSSMREYHPWFSCVNIEMSLGFDS